MQGSQTVRVASISLTSVFVVLAASVVEGADQAWRTPAGHVFKESEVSADQARELARKYPVLVLENVKTLSPGVAEALVTPYMDTFLTLPALESLDVEAAMKLSARRGHLRLWGLKTLTPEAATALCGSKGQGVELNGVTEVSSELASALVGGRRTRLSIGVHTLTGENAPILAGFSGGLWCPNLEVLPIEAAKALGSHRGELALGKAKLTHEVATALLQHDGYLYLTGVARLEPGVGDILARYKSPLFLLLEEIDSVPLAEKLFSGPFTAETVMNLRTMSPGVAAACARHKLGYVPRLESLSPEAASELAKAQWHLTLDGLSSLTPELATALTSGTYAVKLNGIRSLDGPESVAVAEALASSRAPVDLRKLERVSRSALESLRKRSTIKLPAAEKLTIVP
jgi:hypothetical protein